MTFIDIHAHAYRKTCPPADGRTVFATPDEVLQRYDELEIERGYLLPLIGPEVYLPQSNEDCMEMCAASSGRLIPCCNVDPRGISNSADAPMELWLRHYQAQGCKIAGEIMPNLPFLDARCQNLFARISKVGLPLTFDIADQIGERYGFYDDPGLPQLEETLIRHPRLKIFGHGKAFWAEIGELKQTTDRNGYPNYPVKGTGAVVKLLRRYSNLYGDLSAGSGYNALARDIKHAVMFLNEFQDRLMFGTDICSANQKLPLAKFLLDLKNSKLISETVFLKIARINAERLL